MPTYRIKGPWHICFPFDAADATKAMEYVRTTLLPSDHRSDWLQVREAGEWRYAIPSETAILAHPQPVVRKHRPGRPIWTGLR